MYSENPINRDGHIRIANLNLSKRYLRVLVPVFMGLLFILDTKIRPVILSSLADAYINVGVFVAATLLIYYAAESYLGFDISKLKERAPWQQITLAAILGALPGCGGAIVVVSQYAAGHLGFASLVAVLVATMGDAAFLLLSQSPQTGLIVIGLGLGVGIVSGLLVQTLHSPDFLRQTNTDTQMPSCNQLLPIPKGQSWVWMALLAIALPFTLLSAFQAEVPVLAFFSQRFDIPLVIGGTAAVICILMWALLPLRSSFYQGLVAEDSVAIDAKNTDNAKRSKSRFSSIVQRVIHDTNFIMVWVVIAFLSFEVFIHYTGISLEGLFTGALWLAPLIGVLVGFLPGCGPQIIIASLYLQGVAPLSTLLGNAISNDGDALFPAMALAPKAAIIATFYSAIPALLLAYSVHYLVD